MKESLWWDKSWNPVTGCTPISEGCENCWARRMAQRLRGRYGYPEDNPFRVVQHPDKFYEPGTWKKPRRVFVCSMGDLFHENVPGWLIHDIFRTVKWCREHTFIFLTKRPERMRRIWMNIDGIRPDNAWLGVSVENQQRADERIPTLLQIPARIRFVSIEPMLGPVDIKLKSFRKAPTKKWPNSEIEYKKGLDWVILGGETGPGAIPMDLQWVRKVRDQCQEAGVPFFFKQWGEWKPCEACGEALYSTGRKHVFLGNKDLKDWSFVMTKVGSKAAGRLLDGRTWEEMPG